MNGVPHLVVGAHPLVDGMTRTCIEILVTHVWVSTYNHVTTSGTVRARLRHLSSIVMHVWASTYNRARTAA